jgi:hypothetical protein
MQCKSGLSSTGDIKTLLTITGKDVSIAIKPIEG